MGRSQRVLAVVVALVAALSGCTSSVPVQTVGPTSTASSPTTLLAAPPSAPAIPPAEAPPPVVPDSPPPGAASAPSVPDGERTTVEDVVDGDTIVVAGGTRIRLIGIDTPETRDPRQAVQCFGVESSAYTASLLAAGTPVRLVYDVERFDRYQRTLAYVYREADGLFVNASLAAEGYALVATYPPNVAHVEEFTALARTAREEGRGLWAACGGDEPAAAVPPDAVAPPPATGGGGSCDTSYPDVCIPPGPPDLDCGDISARRFRVLPPDPHRFDGSDDDGLGCEG